MSKKKENRALTVHSLVAPRQRILSESNDGGGKERWSVKEVEEASVLLDVEELMRKKDDELEKGGCGGESRS